MLQVLIYKSKDLSIENPVGFKSTFIVYGTFRLDDHLSSLDLHQKQDTHLSLPIPTFKQVSDYVKVTLLHKQWHNTVITMFRYREVVAQSGS